MNYEKELMNALKEYDSRRGYNSHGVPSLESIENNYREKIQRISEVGLTHLYRHTLTDYIQYLTYIVALDYLNNREESNGN